MVEIATLNAKLNKQESLVVKYFGVENEMVSLRSSIMSKDQEIVALRSTIENLTKGMVGESSATTLARPTSTELLS